MSNVENIELDCSNFVFANGFANFSPYIISERNLYANYKAHKNPHSMNQTEKHMQVLELLERLGFPMAEVGTYYYKDLIIKIITLLDDDLASEDQIADLLEQPYSQLYFDVARNELDVGIKSFNEYVLFAFDGIDIDKADSELLERVVKKMDSAISNRQLPLILAQEFRLSIDDSSRALALPIAN